ncbi:MAG: hypothetical protein JXO51_03995 [Candidatus Aminicenantes bacterium]|nr:hypothetical protein [Candidatus Aminicenantes bacterium]
MNNKMADTRKQLAKIVAGKRALRRRLARMPYARKVETVVRLQEIAAEARRAMNQRPIRSAWRLPGTAKHSTQD